MIAYMLFLAPRLNDESKYVDRVQRIEVPQRSTPKSGIEEGWATKHIAKCYDVTSVDRNWGNDMLCINLDGSRFYTDYAGSEEFMNRFFTYDDHLRR